MLDVTALLSNILYEIFTLVATPLLVVSLGKLAGIASGGATFMIPLCLLLLFIQAKNGTLFQSLVELYDFVGFFL